jgi:hypothetical protein
VRSRARRARYDADALSNVPLQPRIVESSLEEVVSESAFATVLGVQGDMFFRLAATLLSTPETEWSRRHFFQLSGEAESLEALLDDYGARHNRTYSFLRELVASVRSFALAGFSLAHLAGRIGSYATSLSASEADGACSSLRRGKSFLQAALCKLMSAARAEAQTNGVVFHDDKFPESRFAAGNLRRLPRNRLHVDLTDDEQKVAEVASKFVHAALLFEEIAVRRLADEAEREAYLVRMCTEERARVYEATVHNLQSAYDTYVKGTSLEEGDARLPKLRGHASAALHLLEAVTHLVHFVERHESHLRDELSARRIQALVRRSEVRDVTLNQLLFTASLYMRRGRGLAEDLLTAFTNVQELVVDLGDELVLHARPAALIVGIVNRYGTPVQLEVGGRTCNAASILDMMVTVGSNPDERRYVFRGDVHPLRDIALLFDAGLGENGLDRLPPALAYLRNER